MQRVQTEERMAVKVKQRLIQYLLSRKEEEGFTLVELIVVVMIIGILSSIAIPSFMNAGDKAKQQEAAVLISSYMKGVQAYYTSNSTPPITGKDLSEFVSVVGCPSNDPVACKTTPVVGPSTTRFWNSPSGLYEIALGQKQGGITYMTAKPAGGYASTGYAVLGCFNQQTGNVKVNLLPNKGVEIPEAEC